MKIGLKFRCYPNVEQTQLIDQTLGNSRFVYNYFLNKKNQYWLKNKYLPKDKRAKPPTHFDDIKFLKPLKKSVFSIDLNLAQSFFEQNPNIDWLTINSVQFETLKNYWLQKSLSTALQQSLKHLDNSFQKFYTKKSGYPQFKKKNNNQSFTITPNNWTFKEVDLNNIENVNKFNFRNQLNTSSIPHLHHDFYLNKTTSPLKIKFDRDFNPAKVSKVTISKTPSGHYYICFLVDEALPDLKSNNYNEIVQKNNKVIAIDLGIKNTLTTLTENIQLNNSISVQNKAIGNLSSDNVSAIFSTKKLIGFKKHQRRLAKEQRKLSRTQKGSNNRQKQRIKVAKIHQNLVNYRNNFYHETSTDLIKNNDKIIIEDLDIKGMMKDKKMAKGISQQSWGIFINMLKYKSSWYGKELTVADRFFPSSKLCSACDEYNPNYGLAKSKTKKLYIPDVWTCSFCKTIHQRDENACKNLMKYEVLKNTYLKTNSKKIAVNPAIRIKKKKLTENQSNSKVKIYRYEVNQSSTINNTISLSGRDLNACVK